MLPGITYTFDEVICTYGPLRLLTIVCSENMANITLNYYCSEHGNDTVWKYYAWKLWGCSLGPVLVGSKAVTQSRLLCPAEHRIILSILSQAASRSDGKRHSFTLWQIHILKWYCKITICYFNFNSAELDLWKFASRDRGQRTSDKTKGPHFSVKRIFASQEIHNAFVWHCICVRTTFNVETIQ